MRQTSTASGFRGLVGLIAASSACLAGSSLDASQPARSAIYSAAPSSVDRPVSRKIDSHLRRLILDSENKAPITWALPSVTEPRLFRTELDTDGTLSVAIFVKSTDVEQTKLTLAALGGSLRVEAGDILVGTIPAASLEVLAEHSETVSIAASYYSVPLRDVSRPATKADLVQAGTGLTSPKTGSGVIVGIIDTGIDYTRPDFKTPAGATRIRSIWDISGVAAGGAARICRPTQVNASTCPEKDLNGHGTHVAGIAAGNGLTQSGFIGMAPDAEIVAAKASRSTTAESRFADDDVVAAASYIFQQAQAAGKPAVINMSIGGYGDSPLDGTSLYEQGLSNLTGAGKILVAAAGNEGSDIVHLSYTTSGTSYADAMETMWVPAASGGTGFTYLWYGAGSISVGVAARTTPDQTTGILASPAMGPGQSTGGLMNLTDASGRVIAKYQIDATTTSYPQNGSHAVGVSLQPIVSGYYFSLYTYGTGTFDAWANDMTFGTKSGPGNSWKPGDSTRTIGAPATSRKVIAVGAYTTKKSWIDASGQSQSFSSWCGLPNTDAPGDIACFSSRGPTRDGRVKPDLAAPGHRIASDLSVDSLAKQQPSDVLHGGRLLMESGTSQAAPHVAGIVALMLQTQPTLTYEQSLQFLQSTAAKDSFTGSSANNTWGAGKVDALAAVQAVTGGGGGGGSGSCFPDSDTICLAGGRFSVQATFVDYSGTPGQGKAAKMTDTAGYFYFFDSSNVELVAKFVSSCNGSSGNWTIYASGLTDVQVLFKVTDTKTGLYREYPNALGHRFTTIADGPFTCP